MDRIPTLVLVLLCVAANLRQVSGQAAMPDFAEGTPGTIPGAATPPSSSNVVVKELSPAVFAWAVSGWLDRSSSIILAAAYRDGGYNVRVIPDESVERFIVTVGSYDSESAATRDEVRLPLPDRALARVILVSQYVVFPQAATDVVVGEDEQPNQAGLGTAVQFDESSSERKPEPSVNRFRPVLEPIEIQFSLSSNFDSNINHDQEDIVSSVGVVPGLLLRYRSTSYKPIVVASLGVSRHEYSGTSNWDRTSHLAVIAVSPRFDGSLRTKSSLQLAKNGSFEDRDLSDQVQVEHEFEYRFSSDYRLHAYGALRWKYPKVGDDDAFKPNVGVVFEQKLDGDRTWEMGARYEINDEAIARGDYKRWTFELQYEVPVSTRGELGFEIKHRRKFYKNRTVEIEDEDYLRRDSRWVLSVGYEFIVSQSLVANLSYKFESRDSNDPGKPFEAHQVDFGLYLRL